MTIIRHHQHQPILHLPSMGRRPGSLRSYRSFCSDLTEALFEEEEEEEEEEDGDKESDNEEEEVEWSLEMENRDGENQRGLDWDSLGVLGLASKLSRDTKSRYNIARKKTCSLCDLTSLLTPWYFQARDLPGKRLLPPQVLNVQPCYVEASKRSSGFSLASPA